MLTFIIPTRDRPERLILTMRALGALDAAAIARADGAEIIVIDNASRVLPVLPTRLASGIDSRLIPLSSNHAAASRNLGAREARGEWLIMLDDDSAPLDCGFLRAIADAGPDVAAIGAEMFLPTGAREAGGLPEVFTGCGVAIRAAVFNELGGYDPTFHYYAEEYDLSARLILTGYRIVHDRRFRVMHHKDAGGRDMNTILARLVRNNGWVMQRYAPEGVRERFINDTIERYGAIARKEHAEAGFARGLDELRATLNVQPRREMTMEQWDRFTGLAHARAHLARALGRAVRDTETADGVGDAGAGAPLTRQVHLLARGKNDWAVEQALCELGWAITDDVARAAARIIATLSPGPMLDALDAFDALRSTPGPPIITPWDVDRCRADACIS